MKPEPLKFQKRILLSERGRISRNIVFEEDVKSALQGLLEDIENYFKSQIDKEDSEHISFCYICGRAVLGRKHHIEYHLKPIREKIKKWFPDVIENQKRE